MDLPTLETFADALKAKFALPGSASPEDQLKPVVADVFKSAGSGYGLTVETRTETHLSDHKVRPDVAVYVGGLKLVSDDRQPKSRASSCDGRS